MLHQLAHQGQHVAVAVGCAGLQGKPLVQCQGFVLEQRVEALQRGLGQFAAADHQGRQGIEAVSHVAGVFEALESLARPHGVAAVAGGQAQVGQRQPGQRAAAGAGAVGRVGAVGFVGIKGPGPVVEQLACHLGAHGLAHGVHALRVHLGQLLGDVGFGGQGQHQILEGGVQLGVAQHRAHGGDERRVERFGGHRAGFGDGLERTAQGQALCRFPAVEGVGVMGQQHQQLGVGVVALQHHRGAETAQQ